MGIQQHAVPAGRLAQSVDLLAQRQELLACILEGVHQLGVTGAQRVDPGLELLHLTGRPMAAGRALQLLTQERRLPAKLLQFSRILTVRVAQSLRTIRLTHYPAPSPHCTEGGEVGTPNATGD